MRTLAVQPKLILAQLGVAEKGEDGASKVTQSPFRWNWSSLVFNIKIQVVKPFDEPIYISLFFNRFKFYYGYCVF